MSQGTEEEGGMCGEDRDRAREGLEGAAPAECEGKNVKNRSKKQIMHINAACGRNCISG